MCPLTPKKMEFFVFYGGIETFCIFAKSKLIVMDDIVFVVTSDDIRRMPPDRFRKMMIVLISIYSIGLIGIILAAIFWA